MSYKKIKKVCLHGSVKDIKNIYHVFDCTSTFRVNISHRMAFLMRHFSDLIKLSHEVLENCDCDNIIAFMGLDNALAVHVYTIITNEHIKRIPELLNSIDLSFRQISHIIFDSCVQKNIVSRAESIYKNNDWIIDHQSRFCHYKPSDISEEMYKYLLSINLYRCRKDHLYTILKKDLVEYFRYFLENYPETLREIWLKKMICYVKSCEMFDLILQSGVLGNDLYDIEPTVRKIFRREPILQRRLLSLFKVNACNFAYIIIDSIANMSSCTLNIIQIAQQIGLPKMCYNDVLRHACMINSVDTIDIIFQILKISVEQAEDVLNGIWKGSFYKSVKVFEQMSHEQVVRYAEMYQLKEHYAKLSVYWANYFKITVNKKMKISGGLYDVIFIHSYVR